jgi:hypothetical protein
MAIAGIPIIRTVRMAYVDVWRAARAMPGLLLVSVVFVFALRQVEFSTVPKSMREFPVAEFAAIILVNLMRMPLSIAIYRFLLAAEVTAAYAIDFRARRFRRFFAWSVALSSVWLMTGIVAYMWSAEDTVGWVGTAVAMLAYGIAAVWLVILFPAIAIDAPGAAVSNSIADSRRHFLNILLLYVAAAGTMVFAILSCFVVAALVVVFTLDTATEADLPDWVLAVLATVVILVPSLIVGVDARIFQVLADRVRRPSS